MTSASLLTFAKGARLVGPLTSNECFVCLTKPHKRFGDIIGHEHSEVMKHFLYTTVSNACLFDNSMNSSSEKKCSHDRAPIFHR